MTAPMMILDRRDDFTDYLQDSLDARIPLGTGLGRYAWRAM